MNYYLTDTFYRTYKDGRLVNTEIILSCYLTNIKSFNKYKQPLSRGWRNMIIGVITNQPG